MSDRYYRKHGLEGDNRSNGFKIAKAGLNQISGFEFTDNLVNRNVCYTVADFLEGDTHLAEMKKGTIGKSKFLRGFDNIGWSEWEDIDYSGAKEKFGYPLLGAIGNKNKISHIFVILGEDKNGIPIIFHKPGVNPYILIKGIRNLGWMYQGITYFKKL